MPDNGTAYTACSAAARQLLREPELRPITRYSEGVPEGVWTELDVVHLAAKVARLHEMPSDVAEAWFRVAHRDASQVMGTGNGLFETGRVVRFGGVHVPGVDKPDWARLESKIVYAATDTIDRLVTPNGVFNSLTYEQALSLDPSLVKKRGPRARANRNDFQPWADQFERRRSSAEIQEENLRLRTENAALRTHNDDLVRRVEEVEQELATMRERSIEELHLHIEALRAGTLSQSSVSLP